jgi:hypothetical protein
MSAQIGRKGEKESFSFFFPSRFLSPSSTHLYPNRLSWIPRKASIIIKREACIVSHVKLCHACDTSVFVLPIPENEHNIAERQ